MKKHLYIFFVFLMTLVACNSTDWKKRPSSAVAEANGQYLYENEVRELTALATNSEDSAKLLEDYIEKWATEILIYDLAYDKNQEIEDQVEKYRRSLYTHAYEQKLIEKRMSKQVDEISIQQFYEQHKEHFILSESIMKGLLLIVPIDAPNLNSLRKDVKELKGDNLEQIEKYAYKYAKGYELFFDEWRTTSQLMVSVPLKDKVWQNQMAQNMYYEQSDSLYVYILKAKDFYRQGAEMPINYAQEEIKKVILDQRKVHFIATEKHKIYENAVKRGKVKK